MSRYDFIYTSMVRPVLIGRYIYCNSFCIPNYDKVIFNITLDKTNDLRDLRILYSILLLELMTASRPFIKNIRIIYRMKTKKLAIVINLNLFNYKKFEFIDFLLNYILPVFLIFYVEKKLILNPLNGSLSLSFNEVTNLSGIPPIYYK
jgi:hypothetical protein